MRRWSTTVSDIVPLVIAVGILLILAYNSWNLIGAVRRDPRFLWFLGACVGGGILVCVLFDWIKRVMR